MFLVAPGNDHEVNVTVPNDDAISCKVQNMEAIPAMTITFTLTVQDTARWINQLHCFGWKGWPQLGVVWQRKASPFGLLIMNDVFSVSPIDVRVGNITTPGGKTKHSYKSIPEITIMSLLIWRFRILDFAESSRFCFHLGWWEEFGGAWQLKGSLFNTCIYVLYWTIRITQRCLGRWGKQSQALKYLKMLISENSTPPPW